MEISELYSLDSFEKSMKLICQIMSTFKRWVVKTAIMFILLLHFKIFKHFASNIAKTLLSTLEWI